MGMQQLGRKVALGVAVVLTLAGDSRGWRPDRFSNHRRLYEEPDLAHGRCSNISELSQGVVMPVAIRKPRLLTAKFAGGVSDRRTDTYYWLADKADPGVVAHLEAENNATEAVMAATTGLQDELYQEMKGRILPADRYPPQRGPGYWYYWYRVDGGQYDIFARRKFPANVKPASIHDEMDTSQPEQVLLDQNALAKESGTEYMAVGEVSLSTDGNLLAYAVDLTGSESYSLYIKNVSAPTTAGKQQLWGPIADATGQPVAWAADNSTLFTVGTERGGRRSTLLWRYTVGPRGLSRGLLVHNETEAGKWLSLGRSHNHGVLYLLSSSASTTTASILPASNPTGVWTALAPKVAGRQVYWVEARGSQVFTLVSDASRRNGELLVAPISKPTHTTVLIDHSTDSKLESFSIFTGHLVVMARERGAVTPLVYDLPAPVNQEVRELGEARELQFSEHAYSLEPGAQGDFQGAVARVHYTSYTTPPTTYDLDLITGEKAVRKQMEVVGGYESSAYHSERIWARAKDGVEVPVSLVYKKELLRVGGAGSPLLLEGYGSYGIAIDPYFSTNRLSLLDRGFVCAWAHVRGGGELGAYWHAGGKVMSKRNTFTDFIAAAEHLHKEGYSSPARTAIWGASAGGLLMGAVLNMRPDLFKAVIMDVPFVDVLTTERDVTLPLTVGEWEEWGDPLHNRTVYDYIKSYSPIDNVVKMAYPHVLATGSMSDSRVGYWEPAKMIAKLRSTATSKNLLLLKTNMNAGHFSSSGRYDRLREIAMKYSFLITTIAACSSTDKAQGGIPFSRELMEGAAAAGIALVIAGVGALFCCLCWRPGEKPHQPVDKLSNLELRAFPHQAGFQPVEDPSQRGKATLLPAGHQSSSAPESYADRHQSQLSPATQARLGTIRTGRPQPNAWS